MCWLPFVASLPIKIRSVTVFYEGVDEDGKDCDGVSWAEVLLPLSFELECGVTQPATWFELFDESIGWTVLLPGNKSVGKSVAYDGGGSISS